MVEFDLNINSRSGFSSTIHEEGYLDNITINSTENKNESTIEVCIDVMEIESRYMDNGLRLIQYEIHVIFFDT